MLSLCKYQIKSGILYDENKWVWSIETYIDQQQSIQSFSEFSLLLFDCFVIW